MVAANGPVPDPGAEARQVPRARRRRSRRAAERLVADGRVALDGETVTDPARPSSATPRSSVDGRGARRPRAARRLRAEQAGRGALDRARHARAPDCHAGSSRPAGCVCTRSGRLDADSGGLILLTNDGELANRLTHPRYEVPKTYRARVARRPGGRAALERAARGHRARRRPDGARAGAAARPQMRSRSRSTKAATARCAGCARRSVIPSSS